MSSNAHETTAARGKGRSLRSLSITQKRGCADAIRYSNEVIGSTWGHLKTGKVPQRSVPSSRKSSTLVRSVCEHLRQQRRNHAWGRRSDAGRFFGKTSRVDHYTTQKRDVPFSTNPQGLHPQKVRKETTIRHLVRRRQIGARSGQNDLGTNL